jgi:glucose-1-phosphate adenylyltransferase
MFSKGFVEVLAAQQTNESADWYQGTADAVRQNISYIERENPDEVLILSGDQLYRMNYRDLIETHRGHNADITIAAIPVQENQTTGFGLMSMDSHSRITGFVEKPSTHEERQPYYTSAEWIERRGIICGGRHYLANMGIYLFKTKVLYDLLIAKPLATDFGKEVFPRNYKTKKVCAHLFDGYWEDLGTIRSYHEACLALAGPNPPFDFFSTDGVIYTRMRNLPPSRFDGAILEHSVVADGCIIGNGTRIERSLIGVRSMIGADCTIRDVVLIGSDQFETATEKANNAQAGIPNLNIGEGTVIEKAILDKDCRIGKRVKLVNQERKQVFDGPNGMYHIRDGIICVPRGTIIPDGAIV